MSDTAAAYACGPCRVSKVGCDKSRPHCMRCLRKGLDCFYAPKAAPRGRKCGNRRATVPGDTSDNPTSISTESRCLGSQSPGTNSDSKSSPTSLVQKRNRIPKACLRCRQLKIKCDRQQPCSRCIKANGSHNCHYPRPATGDGNSLDKQSIPLWKQTFHSGIHWSGLVRNIQSLLKHRRWAENQEQDDEHISFSSVDNIFGNIGPLSSAPRRTLLSYIPPRNVADSFIAQYLDSVEPFHQILHVPTFKEELEAFWSRPGTIGDGWLAQLFAILALGCQLQCISVSTNNTNMGISPDRLFEGAQTCLQRTPFMIRPQLTTIRALCLFVIFKQTKVMMTCVECDALWPATGLIVRLAVLLGLHSTDSAQGPQFDPSETTIRNRLWAAVILLDLRQSLAAGMPIIPPSRDLIAEPLFTIHQQTPGAGSEHKDLVFPLVLYDILPQIFRILELATSPQVSLAYSQVASYDRQIRALLKYHETSFLAPEQESNTNSVHAARFQWTMTNVFFRRVLLALHSRLYQEPDASTRYPVSYWSSLECSIALLSAQRELWDTARSDPSSPSSVSSLEARTAGFFARLFIQEFFLAVVTICFHLVHKQSPLVSGNGLWCQGHARRTILELLRSCRDIWQFEKGASVCHGRSFRMIDSMLRFLEGSRGDDGEDKQDVDEVGSGPLVEVATCMCAKEGCEIFALEQWVDGVGLGAGY